MRVLLDTHVLLWAASAPEELKDEARDAIENRENEIFVSAATAWEIAIKVGLGKLTIPGDAAVWLPARVRSLGFAFLAIEAAHALAVGALPKIHADPFDRMMIAQSQCEGLIFATRDSESLKYPVRSLMA